MPAGIEYVGPMPDVVHEVTTFSAGMPAGSRHKQAARALIEYLHSAEARPTLEKTGLDLIR